MHLSRKQFLAGAAGAGAAAILPRHSARAAEFTYKLGHDQQLTHPQHIRAKEAADLIGRESNGRLVVTVYPASQLGGMSQMLTQVRSGALELLQIGDSILANVVPVTSLAATPFAFRGYDDFWSAMDGDFGKYLHAQIEKIGLHVFEKGWDDGFRHVLTSGKPVLAPADMKGMKIRVPEAPIPTALFRAFGASPTPLNNNELYTALQTHLVDGAEQPLISIESTKYYEITKYISLTSHQPTPNEMIMNGAAWRRLPADLQEILTRNLNKAALLQRQDIAAGDEQLMQQLKQQGQSFVTPDYNAFRDALEKAGLYARWRDTYSAEAFALLEKTQGKLA